mgnify:CR=1 FL=1
MSSTVLPAQETTPAPMSVFERYLTVWVFLCIVAGIAGLALAGAAGQGVPDPLGIAALAGGLPAYLARGDDPATAARLLEDAIEAYRAANDDASPLHRMWARRVA